MLSCVYLSLFLFLLFFLFILLYFMFVFLFIIILGPGPSPITIGPKSIYFATTKHKRTRPNGPAICKFTLPGLPLASTPKARQFASLPCQPCLQHHSSCRTTHDHVKPSHAKLEPPTCMKPCTTSLATYRSRVSSLFVPKPTD